MKIQKGKYYLRRWGEGRPGSRPMLVAARQFDRSLDAYGFLSAHREELAGYVPDTGKQIMNSIHGVVLVKFVEVE